MKFELYSHFLRKWRCTMSTQTSTLYTFLKKTENDNAVNENTLENAIFKFLKICSANGIFYLIVILVFNQCYSRCTFSISQNHIETTRTKTHWEKLFIYSLSTSHKLFEIDCLFSYQNEISPTRNLRQCQSYHIFFPQIINRNLAPELLIICQQLLIGTDTDKVPSGG